MFSSVIKWVRRIPFSIELVKLVKEYGTESGNWNKKAVHISPYIIGHRCRKNIKEYFDGESNLKLLTPGQIVDWLSGCEYMARTNKEGLSDEWLHPIEFEKLKKGHCVDFSLFAWRKLCEAGYKAELIFGTRFRDGEERQHAWVSFHKNNSAYLFESLPISGRECIEPIEDVKSIYVPWSSFDCEFQYYFYTGYFNAFNRLGRNVQISN